MSEITKIGFSPDIKVLVVEDTPERIAWFRERLPVDAIYTTTAKEAIEFLKSGDNALKLDAVFLDCDLGDGPETGIDVARAMVDSYFVGSVTIHSWNSDAVKRAASILGDPDLVDVIPFGQFDIYFLDEKA